MKITITLIIIAAVILTIFLTKKSFYEEREFEIQGRKLVVEIADTAEKRSKGLMYRESLEENKGMLFIFPNIAKHSFWMANTKIPLDIIWMDEEFKVVHTEQNVPPCKSKILIDCPKYKSEHPAKYVLEVNAGWWK